MRDKVKPAGDAFETIIAAYRNETSAEAFQEWFRDNFTQLIHAACAAYDLWWGRRPLHVSLLEWYPQDALVNAKIKR